MKPTGMLYMSVEIVSDLKAENAALREVVEKADKLYRIFVNREGDTNASEAYRLARESVKVDG